MSDFLRRAWSPMVDLEVRADGDGRTVFGIAVPFDSPTEIREGGEEFTEVFRMGAFAQTINVGAERVKFLVNHDRIGRLPLGRAISLREDPSGLVGEFRVSQTREGDEVLELIRDGVLDAFSIGFRPQRDKWNADRSFVERTEVHLSEVSTVAFPAYAGAEIAGVRTGETQHLDIDADQDAADPGTSDDHLDAGAAQTIFVPQNRTMLAAYLRGIDL